MIRNNNLIEKVFPNSIAEEMGIEPGDRLMSINGREIKDVIDYLYEISDTYIEIKLEKQNKEHWVLEIDKDYDEELGIKFQNEIMDSAKSCRNKCIFCFVDQLPSNMRKSLYFKDDDSRLSFLHGNFVTMTNLTDQDIDRIIEYNISPINVSIHTTNPRLRSQMLNNKNAGNILGILQKLTSNRIKVNGQIVLCPDINDGGELDNTIKDLYSLYPNLHSLAIVPVGLTRFRKNLFPLALFNENSAKEVINQINKWQILLKENIETNFVYLSDEFYILANAQLPSYDQYEDFPQIENGVGLMRQFEFEFLKYLDTVDKNMVINKTFSMITGKSAKPFLEGLVSKLTNKVKGLKINVYDITNNYFGKTVTVSGLITGQDILSQLKDKDLGNGIIIPKSMLKSDEEIFLDDMTIIDLANQLNTIVIPCEVSGKGLIEILTK